MLITLLFGVVLQMLNAIFFLVSFGHKVVTIPVVDSYLVTAFGWWNSFLYEFPPLAIVWDLFLIYMAFEIALVIVKIFFGHRVSI